METMAMTRTPEDWRGSDLRSRREVVEYLARRGGVLEDKTGLVVGKMREDLGRGRALAQLLADMEADGMLRREVRGRRTFRIELLDDWGLAPAPHIEAVPDLEPEGEMDFDGVDLTALAETLLAITLKRMQQQPEATEEGLSARQLASRLRQAERSLTETQGKLRDANEANSDLKAQLDEARLTVKALENNLQVAQAELQKVQASRPKTRGVPIGERIGPKEKQALEQLMKAAPTRRDTTKRTASD